MNKKNKQFIIQKYLDHPLLLHQYYKFDLRLFILVCDEGSFLCDKFLVRVCPEKYNLKDINNVKQHLTNVHLHGENKFTSRQFHTVSELQYLRNKLIDFCHQYLSNFLNDHYSTLDNKIRCYHLLGIDLILDQDEKIWLLEINDNAGGDTSIESYLASIMARAAISTIKPLKKPHDIFIELKPL